jgi:putative CocE/NonD family hydrolase
MPSHPDFLRKSCYVAVRDGTRLALDVFHPSGPYSTESRLPCIWALDCYRRAHIEDGRYCTIIDRFPWLTALLRHGYVVAVADERGSGASFGSRSIPLDSRTMWDAYDITEWLSRQPWCNGAIGMFGRSYLAVTQFLCAATCPPHLKAIVPQMSLFDLYEFVYPGGMYRRGFSRWLQMVDERAADRRNARVDADDDGILLAEALRQHEANADADAYYRDLPYRDSVDSSGAASYFDTSPSTHLSAINRSGVAVFQIAGWFDMWPRDAVTWFNNLTVPQKLVIGPWAHSQTAGIDLATEHLRWYDHWLKGIDTGVMRGPRIRFYTMGAPAATAWRTAWTWSLRTQRCVDFYFGPADCGGSLVPDYPAALTAECGDSRTADYSATTGATSRWTHGYGAPFAYSDMAENDQRGWNYTSAPLPRDLEVSGHPVVHLWVSVTAPDAGFFGYLECVDEQGHSTYVTEGNLRGRHRELDTAEHCFMGLPYHSGLESGAKDLPGEPCELVFDLLPTSFLFRRGSRVRLAITCADRDNVAAPETEPAPTVTIHRSATYPSRIILPVVQVAEEENPYPFLV